MQLREDANLIIDNAIKFVQPNSAVKNAINKIELCKGKTILVSAGKAAWQMASSAYDLLGDKIYKGIVITKYDHSKGPIGDLVICEAGHPVPDENSYRATEKAIEMVSGLSKDDNVLFLLSGGGSALFEKPLIPDEDMQKLTQEMLASGADIVEMNTVRKRFSGVKGGKFAELCAPAHVYTVVLSDILGDPLDMIASGPAYPDSKTSADAINVVNKYNLTLTSLMKELIKVETPKELYNVTTYVTGSVKQLCASAKETCESLGYKPIVLTDSLCCEAREAGTFLSNIAQYYNDTKESLAFIMGGETVVHITGSGKGGRNQELALAAAKGISGIENIAIFSIGSDGTDGPTDAAGGYVDSDTFKILKEKELDVFKVLNDNDSYNALRVCNGLIMTGPTGTNVNDLTVLLIKRQ